MEDFNSKSLIPALVGIILIIAGILIPKVVTMGPEGQYTELKSINMSLENDYEVKRSSMVAANKIASTKYETIQEVANRHVADDEKVNAFMAEVFNWDSAKGFDNVKAHIQANYEVDDMFMIMFFPNATYTVAELDAMKEEAASEESIDTEETETPTDASEDVESEEASTEATTEETAPETELNVTNKIDDMKITARCDAIDSYLINSETVGNDYTYLARLAITRTVNGETSTEVMLIKYTIGADGIIRNIRGIV